MPPWAYSNLPTRSVEASVNAPLTWPNRLAFQNVLAQRGAIEGHEGLVLPRAVLVDGLGDQLLARARLPLDQHAGVGRRDAFQALDHVAHLRAVADDALEAKLLVQPPLQFQVGLLQARALGGLFHARPKLGHVERLQQVVESPAPHRLDGRGDGAVAGHQDHFGVGLLGLGAGQNAQPVDVVHHQVGDDHVEGRAFDQPGPLVARGGHPATIADSLQAFGHGLGMGAVVVDDQHFGGRIEARMGRFGFGWAHQADDTALKEERGVGRGETTASCCAQGKRRRTIPMGGGLPPLFRIPSEMSSPRRCLSLGRGHQAATARRTA